MPERKSKMKKLLSLSLLFLCFSAVILNGCSAVNDLTEDNRVTWDSVSQVKTGKPNEGGQFDNESALQTAVTGAMIEGITNPTAAPEASVVRSIMRIPGSLFGLVVNPDKYRNLIIKIKRKDGTEENQTLLPRSARDLCLPPGEKEYSITYSQRGQADFSQSEWSITTLVFSPIALAKGYKYEKLKTGSMTEYEQIITLPQDITVNAYFAFIGWGY